MHLFANWFDKDIDQSETTLQDHCISGDCSHLTRQMYKISVLKWAVFIVWIVFRSSVLPRSINGYAWHLHNLLRNGKIRLWGYFYTIFGTMYGRIYSLAVNSMTGWCMLLIMQVWCVLFEIFRHQTDHFALVDLVFHYTCRCEQFGVWTEWPRFQFCTQASTRFSHWRDRLTLSNKLIRLRSCLPVRAFFYASFKLLYNINAPPCNVMLQVHSETRTCARWV